MSKLNWEEEIKVVLIDFSTPPNRLYQKISISSLIIFEKKSNLHLECTKKGSRWLSDGVSNNIREKKEIYLKLPIWRFSKILWHLLDLLLIAKFDSVLDIVVYNGPIIFWAFLIYCVCLIQCIFWLKYYKADM